MSVVLKAGDENSRNYNDQLVDQIKTMDGLQK